MKRENGIEREYREMMTQAAPDLWERIESGLEDHAETGGAESSHAETDRKETGRILHLPRRRMYGAAAAVAAVLVILVAAPGFLEMNKIGSSSTARFAAGGAAYDMGATLPETTAAAPEMAAEGGVDGAAAAGGAVAAEMAEDEYGEAATQEYRSGDLPESNEGQNTGSASLSAGQYIETDLKDTRFLCQVTIEKASNSEKADGRPHIRYEARVDDIFYMSEDTDTEAVEKGDSIIIEAAADGTEDLQQDSFMMKEGGVYIVPLTVRDGALEPVFPDEPQIEIKEDGGYLFPDRYVSLQDEETAVMQDGSDEGQGNPDGQVHIRKDERFIADLVGLIKAYTASSGD